MVIKINKGNIESLISTIKGIAPANYASMERLVTCVQFLEAVLENSEEEKTEEVKEDADN